ncbi:metal-dependent hydrolase, partial [Acinetobacter seifertii]|uniref:metal-dependent hydrolase n=1 Tax=Acinetobacter seifertii TaxID=1530123 RepID=UPI0032B5C050
MAQYQKIDFSNKGSIPIRHLNIGFDGKEIDIEFYVNNQFATLFFATLSVFLTYGEDLVIETARHHREFIQDPVLKQRVTSLIVKLLYYSYKIRKKLEITHRLSRSTILYAY